MSTLSGSGSTLFSVSYQQEAKKLETILKEKFPHFKVFTTPFDNYGVKIEY